MNQEHKRIVDEPFEDLANAIIKEACRDYIGDDKRAKESAIRFFNSDWFRTLTKIDPTYLMKKLDEDKDYIINKKLLRRE